MPYLTCIGGHGVAGKTQSGTGSRGYWVFRRARTVIVRFGAVRVHRSRSVRIEWVGEPREVRYAVSSVIAARDLIRQILAEKTRPAHGYTRLKVGRKIW